MSMNRGMVDKLLHSYARSQIQCLESSLQNPVAWAPISAPLLTSYVTLGKLLSFSSDSFPPSGTRRMTNSLLCRAIVRVR